MNQLSKFTPSRVLPAVALGAPKPYLPSGTPHWALFSSSPSTLAFGDSILASRTSRQREVRNAHLSFAMQASGSRSC